MVAAAGATDVLGDPIPEPLGKILHRLTNAPPVYQMEMRLMDLAPLVIVGTCRARSPPPICVACRRAGALLCPTLESYTLEGEITCDEALCTYGFKYEGKPVDIVDNEFVWVHFKYEEKMTEFEKSSVDLGVTPCLEKSHLNKYFTHAEITKKFGNTYCIDPTREYFIQGKSSSGYPVRRVWFNIRHCD